MDCMQVRGKFVQYIEGLLPDEENALIDNHLEKCERCNRELTDIKDIRDRLVLSGRHNRSIDLEDRIFNQIICEQNNRLKLAGKPNHWLGNWRSIMKSRITRLSAAAVAVVAIMVTISLFNRYISTATAEGVLSDAVKAVSGLNSVHMKARMRTSQAGNLDSINFNSDFLPVEMWKKVDQDGLLQWRVEKSGGTFIIMDGKTTVMFVPPKGAFKLEKTYPLGYGFGTWIGRLLDVQGLLDNELQKAKDDPNRKVRLIHEKIDGKDKIILEVDVLTNKADNDFLRNNLISKSDSLREYQFDAETKLLEGFKVYVIEGGNEILVFEITDIEYNAKIDDSVFVPDLPDDVMYVTERQDLSYDEKYSLMTPREIAAAFFNSCSKGEWDEFLKLAPMDEINQGLKERLIGLEMISIGETKKIEVYEGYNVWFVPYEIRYNNGEINKNTLEMIYNEKVGRYLIGAGF